jgi:hypothetical protein
MFWGPPLEGTGTRCLVVEAKIRVADGSVVATRGTRRAERRAYREALAARIREAIASGEIKNRAQAARVLGVSRAVMGRLIEQPRRFQPTGWAGSGQAYW